MKFNKWTLGLAAIGVVSLASAAKAEEGANAVMTALSSTTISGYVDTSAQWNFGTGHAWAPPYRFGGADKADGFNLNTVQVRIDKPLDEADWAAGYRVDLWAGPDANTLATQSVLASGASDFAVKQAYVALRVPFQNGVDVKMGVFDSIIGYESVESPNNPNFTRSYGHTIEPQTHTGALASYRFNDYVQASAGVANTIGPSINSRAQGGSSASIGGPLAPLWSAVIPGGVITSGLNAKAESYKTYMGSVALTAPADWGWLEGSTLYGGVVNGFNNSVLGSGVGENQTSYYVGATLATPVTGLRLGAAFDYLDVHDFELTTVGLGGGEADLDAWAVAGYASYQATEKLSLHGRAEYIEADLDVDLPGGGSVSADGKIFAVTGTVQYDLWQNVISRVELRWDHSASGDKIFGGSTSDSINGNGNGFSSSSPDRKNAWMLAANIIYKF